MPETTNTRQSSPRLTRRRFLRYMGMAGAAAGAATLLSTYEGFFRVSRAAPGALTPTAEFKTVRTVCSPNCTGACGMRAYVRDGRVVKIRQAADFPTPAYNPRGCMKGLSFMQTLYGPDRIRKPLMRVGARGEGKWREVSWDEALDFIAGKLKEIIQRDGPRSIYFFPQLPGTGPVQKGSATRLAALLGASHGTFYDFNGDLPLSMPITFGVQCSEHESKDWANARCLLLFGANPVETRIPDAHFLMDAVEKGAPLIVFDPTFSPTAAKADVWVRLRPGTDGAVALAMANVILADGAADLDFMAAYTDAPLLVRADTKKRLREADLVAGGSPDRFVLWDQVRGGPHVVGTDRLGIPPGTRPALEGTFRVKLADGSEVEVAPCFQHVLDAVRRYTPEKAEELSGVPADTIRKVARIYASHRPGAIIMGGAANHWYHGDLAGRALALLTALTGNIGKSGGGISVYVGQYKLRFDVSKWWFPDGKRPNFVPPMYLIEGPTPTMNPAIKLPENGFKAILISHSNMMNQSPNLNKLWSRLEKMDLIVVMDFQMTPTAELADVVLPAASWYEKYDLIASPLHPHLQLMQPAIEPVGEARPELWIYRELARRLDPALARYYEMDEEAIIRLLLETGGPEVEGITLEDLKKGPVRLRVPDPDVMFYEQIHEFKPFPTRTYPFPLKATQAFVKTGRAEFYKEEDRFLERGEEVPVYKPPFGASGEDQSRYPLVLLSPHSRWRVHSTYSNLPWLNEIHPRPEVYIHPDDARARGIRHGALVELFNDRGRTVLWARVTRNVPPGTVVLYEGWWARYFARGRGVNELTTSAINPIHEIYFLPNVWSPVTAWKEALCDVRPVEGRPL